MTGESGERMMKDVDEEQKAMGAQDRFNGSLNRYKKKTAFVSFTLLSHWS